jgi:hypothetical protein
VLEDDLKKCWKVLVWSEDEGGVKRGDGVIISFDATKPRYQIEEQNRATKFEAQNSRIRCVVGVISDREDQSDLRTSSDQR